MSENLNLINDLLNLISTFQRWVLSAPTGLNPRSGHRSTPVLLRQQLAGLGVVRGRLAQRDEPLQFCRCVCSVFCLDVDLGQGKLQRRNVGGAVDGSFERFDGLRIHLLAGKDLRVGVQDFRSVW